MVEFVSDGLAEGNSMIFMAANKERLYLVSMQKTYDNGNYNWLVDYSLPPLPKCSLLC